MEEIYYNYFFYLTKYTIQFPFIHILLIFFDYLQILVYYFELPLKFINFYANNINDPTPNTNQTTTVQPNSTITYHNDPYAAYLKYISLHCQYKKLIYKDTITNLNVYPYYLLYTILALYILFLISFIIIATRKKIGLNKINDNWFIMIIKHIAINFYLFIFFRLLATCIYDTCFNFIINSTSYLQILLLLFFIVLILTHYAYFTSFCFCVKFDINHKQLNNPLGKEIDYGLLIMKLFIALEVNYTTQNNETVNYFGLFFMLINIATVIFLITRIIIKSINIQDSFKGIGIISFMLSFIFGCLFPHIRSSPFSFFIFVFLVIIIPTLFMLTLRRRIIINIIRSKENYRSQFMLLFEYYQTKDFSSLLQQIVLNEKKDLFFGIENEEKLFNSYLTYLKINLKEEYKKIKSIDSLFYYMLIKIYIALINKKYNAFKFIFKVTKAKDRMKTSNQLYYLNLNFFYNMLQYDINTRGNVDPFQLNYSFHRLFDEVNKCIVLYEHFIQKESLNSSEEYFKFSSSFNAFVVKVKKHYQILDLDKSEEYQKVMFRIILETIRNKSIKKQEDKFNLFIKDEIFNQEEMLEKEYINGNMIKLKIQLNTLNCSILKIGHQLNYLPTKDFFCLFPVKFRKIATDLFYKSISKKNISKDMNNSQIGNYDKFQFIVKDHKENNLEFILMYKLYPDIRNTTLYLDGKYNLSTDGFVITETSSCGEKLVLLSNHLTKLLYIDQEYLNIINQYQYVFTLNMFISDLNAYFSNSSILDALIKQIKELSTIASVEDYDRLLQMHFKLVKKYNENMMLKFELKYSISQHDQIASFNVYRVLKQNQTTKQIKYVNNMDTTLVTKKSKSLLRKTDYDGDQLMQTELMTAYDTKSVSSSTSRMSIYTSHRVSAFKKKNSKKNIYSSNYFVMIFDLLIIILSIVLLIIENKKNKSLRDHIEVYQLNIQLNRVMLNAVISFYALICYDSPPKPIKARSVCINRFTQYLSGIHLEPLEQFAKEELVVKLETFHSRWDLYKKKIISLNNDKISQIIHKQSITSHLTYINGTFINKPTNDTFEEALTVYINKMTMISLLKNFNRIDIYPLFVNDDFYPLYFENNKIKVSSAQLEIYETLFSFFNYATDLFVIQNTVLLETNGKMTDTLNSIIIFISVLIFLNGLLFFIFLIIFYNSNKTVRNIMIRIDKALGNKEHSKRLQSKINLVKDLVKLYHEDPMVIVKKIKDTYKHETTKKGKLIDKNKNKNKSNKDLLTDGNTLNKEYNLSFTTKAYKIKLALVEFVYISFCLIFLGLFIFGFNEIKICLNIMEYSGISEELLYLSIASMQMMEYSNITEYTLYNKLYHTKGNTSNGNGNEKEGKFFESMINTFQQSKQKEDSEKEQIIIIYSKFIKEIDYNCNTLFSTLNDTRFNQIIKNNPQKNYDQLLKEFCSQVTILQYNDERKFFNEIMYGNIKLVGKMKTNSFEINIPKNTNNLYFLISELLFVYRPLRAFISNFYFLDVPNFFLNKHFIFLLLFLIGNIVVQIVNFIILKFSIIEKIEKDFHNLTDIKTALSV